MMTIFKYPLKITDEQMIEMPGGDAKPLSAQFQHGELVVWVLVNPASNMVKHRFTIFGTGNNVEREGIYISTAQDPDTNLVWHVFWG